MVSDCADSVGAPEEDEVPVLEEISQCAAQGLLRFSPDISRLVYMVQGCIEPQRGRRRKSLNVGGVVDKMRGCGL